MSDRRLTKNTQKADDDIREKQLRLTPVVVSDSKGKYLKACVTPDRNPESKILWRPKGGATTFERYLWLKQNVDVLINKYGPLSVYVFTGTCDLTIKQSFKVCASGKRRSRITHSPFIQLRDTSSVELLKRHYVWIQRLLKGKNVKLTFLHVPLYSIEHWNKAKGHPNPSSFKSDDKKLTEYVLSINSFIDTLNRDLGTYSPRLNEDLQRSRKSKKGKQRYSWKFSMYSDGVHPTNKLAKSWLKSISRKIKKDCLCY